MDWSMQLIVYHFNKYWSILVDSHYLLGAKCSLEMPLYYLEKRAFEFKSTVVHGVHFVLFKEHFGNGNAKCHTQLAHCGH
jgi:hypothetical protein